MTFSARYEGRCPDCGEAIHVGDSVRFDDARVVHVDCDPADDPTELRRGEVVCTSCFIVKPCECEVT